MPVGEPVPVADALEEAEEDVEGVALVVWLRVAVAADETERDGLRLGGGVLLVVTLPVDDGEGDDDTDAVADTEGVSVRDRVRRAEWDALPVAEPDGVDDDVAAAVPLALSVGGVDALPVEDAVDAPVAEAVAAALPETEADGATEPDAVTDEVAGGVPEGVGALLGVAGEEGLRVPVPVAVALAVPEADGRPDGARNTLV